MTQPKRILLIAPCRMASTPAFERAARLAEGLNAVLRIVAFVHPDHQDLAAQVAAHQNTHRSPLWAFQKWLNGEAGLLSKEGLHVCAEVVWNTPTVENVCHYIAEAEADYVIKDMQEHIAGDGLMLSTFDWQLLHESPVPLLLVKEVEGARPNRILATIDVMHSEPEVRDMNGSALEIGHMLAQSFGANLHMMSLYDRHALPIAEGDQFHPASILSFKKARQRFDAIADHSSIARDHRHFIVSNASGNVDGYVSQCGFDVMVFGATDHGMTDVLLGRTERRVLGHPPCSLMVLKPGSAFAHQTMRRVEPSAAIYAN